MTRASATLAGNGALTVACGSQLPRLLTTSLCPHSPSLPGKLATAGLPTDPLTSDLHSQRLTVIPPATDPVLGEASWVPQGALVSHRATPQAHSKGALTRQSCSSVSADHGLQGGPAGLRGRSDVSGSFTHTRHATDARFPWDPGMAGAWPGEGWTMPAG